MLDIREIEEKDVEEIHRLEEKNFSDPWGNVGILESLRQKHTVLLGAWVDGKLSGYVIVYLYIDEGEIARIAVDEPCRRQGVASCLLLELENICKEKQIMRLLLDVRESNTAAIKFYKYHGFKEDGRRKNFYTKPAEDAILMSRKIGK